MKINSKKILSVLLVIVTIIPLYAFSAKADVNEPDAIQSLYYEYAKTLPAVSSSGMLTIVNKYHINGSGFTDATIETYVEKRRIIFNVTYWFIVNNGQPNNTWVDTSTSTLYSKTYTFQLPSTGTYRVTAEFTFHGSNGSESPTRQSTVTY